MMKMKRSLAGLLAGILLFPGIAAFAEEPTDAGTVPDSRVSADGAENDSMEDQLIMIAALLNREEVRNLLRFDDVKSIVNDVILKVLRWMADNRPVTMKILAELGVGEEDLACVAKLWDSAERLENASREFQDAENRVRLDEEFTALLEDPEIRETLRCLQMLITRENIETVSRAAIASIDTGEESGLGDGPLTQEALKMELDRRSFAGFLMVLLLGVLEQSDQMQDLVPKLLKKEELWQFLLHAADAGSVVNPVLREELMTLSSDPEVTGFLQRTAEGLSTVVENYIDDLAGSETGSEIPEEKEGVSP